MELHRNPTGKAAFGGREKEDPVSTSPTRSTSLLSGGLDNFGDALDLCAESCRRGRKPSRDAWKDFWVIVAAGGVWLFDSGWPDLDIGGVLLVLFAKLAMRMFRNACLALASDR